MKKSVVKIVISIFSLFALSSCLSTKIDIGKKTDLCALEYSTKGSDFKLKFYGVQNAAETEIQVTQAYWFDNWRNGWTEVRFAASGVINVDKKKNRTVYTIVQPLKIEYVEAAKVRFKDTYLVGQDAVKALNNRLSRIESINEVLTEKYEGKRLEALVLTCGPYLFPEVYKKSMEYLALDKTSNKILGDGTYWNETYTKEKYPEYMWEARNTGTLYRDWEEANDLIYILYNWNIIFCEGQTVKFDRIKTTAPKQKK